MISPVRACGVLAVAAAFLLAPAVVGGSVAPLRVCADPANLPFSNDRREGFENRLAEMLARDLGTRVAYTWWPQRRGFLRNTLNARRCDVVMGVPTALEMLATSRPYYRSTYVFVTRRARHLRLTSLDDPALRQLRVGVPLIGDDGANAPPAHALARRGIVRNVVGYAVVEPPRGADAVPPIVGAVASRDIDVATVWGPIAGYFARRSVEPLDVRPIAPAAEPQPFPLTFDVSLGVRRGDTARLAALNDFLQRRRVPIARLLDSYGVPRVETAEVR